LRRLSRKTSGPSAHRKGANDTPSGLRRCLLWRIERRWLIEARIALLSGRRCRRIQGRDVQGVGRVRRIQPGRNLQGRDARRPHVRLGVVARTGHGSQVLATRETHEGNQDSDQRRTIPHLVTFHEWAGARP
jgi:hypothetical protein